MEVTAPSIGAQTLAMAGMEGIISELANCVRKALDKASAVTAESLATSWLAGNIPVF
ncbi:hypothetical protein D3C81_2100190 [compost metagenome]